MIPRGPDDAGVYEDRQVVLGLRRLSIIDLSPAGRQPMSRADGGLWIVYNGEVYNFRELRKELEGRGHRFHSRTDTEVILALYEEMGTDCVARLRGMFAFAIWDRRTPDPVLFLARDHFGIKPLVYRSTGPSFEFASELPALQAAWSSPGDIDPVALQQFLIFGHVIQPRTILSGVRMLPAAHAMTVRPGAPPHLWRYWDLDHERCAALTSGLGFREQALHLRSLLTEAARQQMVSDVPLGAFLSGGIDSSSLVALMMKVSGRPVHTFAIGYAGASPQLDETEDATRSAGHFHSVHENVQLTGQEVADAVLQGAPRLGQPTIDGLNMYFASRAAARGVTVALAGTGADEIFAGYPWFRDLERSWSTAKWRRATGVSLAKSGLWRLLPRSPIRQNWEMRSLRESLPASYAVCHLQRTPSEALKLLGAASLDPGTMIPFGEEDDPGVADVISRVSRLDLKMFLCSQLLRDADAASMACSLEVRVPFLDLDVVEFAYGLPGSSKHGPLETGGRMTGKRVFIEAVKDLVPCETYRKPKRGFSMPMGEWLQGPLAPLAAEVVSDRAFRDSGLLVPAEMDRLWARFRAGQEPHWPRIWSVIALGLWWSASRGTAVGTAVPSAQPVLESRDSRRSRG